MSEEQQLLAVAGAVLAVAVPAFAVMVVKVDREGAKLEAAIGALAEFLGIFGGLLVQDSEGK